MDSPVQEARNSRTFWGASQSMGPEIVLTMIPSLSTTKDAGRPVV